MQHELRLFLFGKVTATIDGAPVQGFVSAKTLALLAYLAATRRPHSRDVLAALFWGEMAEADAKTNLRQAVANLKKLLEPYLILERDTLALNEAAPHWIDIDEFEREGLVGQGKVKLPANPADLARLQHQLSLYQGDFLEGLLVKDAPEFEEWALTQREHYRQKMVQLLAGLTEYHANRGEYEPAIAYVSRVLTLEMWREDLHGQLMLLYVRHGQRSKALAQYEICKQTLQQELHVVPSPETQALYERIKAAVHLPRHNLPQPATPLIGRAEVLTHLTRQLTDPGCRLLTLLGPGGIGKTRLALEAASQLVDAFINGAFFVSLEAAHTPNEILANMAQAVGFGFVGANDLQAQLWNYLADKELLLVLDNVEQLPGIADVLVALLARCRHVKMLVTSRERIHIAAEMVLAIEGLSYPAELAGVPETVLAAFEAVRLFQVCAARHGVKLDLAANAVSIAEICRLLQGMPLGLELAAAWTRSLTCAEIAAEIRRNLDFLETALRDVPARQRSLRAVFEPSWRMLSPVEQNVFMRLSVFRGGLTRPMAESVAGAGAAVLASLLDKSFLRHEADGRYTLHEVLRQYGAAKLAADSQAHRATHDKHSEVLAHWLAPRADQLKSSQQLGALREISLELDNLHAAWQWAVENMQHSNMALCVDALFQYHVLRGLYQAGQATFSDAIAALETRQAEPGLVASLKARSAYFCGGLDLFEQAVRLANDSWAYWQSVLDALLDALLDASDNALPDSHQEAQTETHACLEAALSLNSLGRAHYFAGQFEPAAVAYRRGLDLRRRAGKPWEVAAALNNLATALTSLGQMTQARTALEECLAMGRLSGDRRLVAYALDNLGIVIAQLGEWEAAHELHVESLALSQALGDVYGTETAWCNTGLSAMRLGRFAEAREYMHNAMIMSREWGHRTLLILNLTNMVLIEFKASKAGLASDVAEWRGHGCEVAALAQSLQLDAYALRVVVCAALIAIHEGRTTLGIGWLAFIEHHPAADTDFAHEVHQVREPLLHKWPDTLAVAYTDLEHVLAEVTRYLACGSSQG